VLADRIPKLEPERRTPLRGSHNLVLICTYEKDEPFAAVVEAARRLDPSICFYITGRVSKAPPELVARAPDNVVFTDFLDEVDYVSLLGSCDVVMDLTLMEDCLVCGAYEALSLGKPMILSNTAALRDYFSQGVIYTANDPEALVRAVREALERREQLARDAQALRQRLQSSWELQCQRLRYYLA
jgi:glycosyltransferase involved in cell wall biosynthesis